MSNWAYTTSRVIPCCTRQKDINIKPRNPSIRWWIHCKILRNTISLAMTLSHSLANQKVWASTIFVQKSLLLSEQTKRKIDNHQNLIRQCHRWVQITYLHHCHQRFQSHSKWSLSLPFLFYLKRAMQLERYQEHHKMVMCNSKLALLLSWRKKVRIKNLCQLIYQRMLIVASWKSLSLKTKSRASKEILLIGIKLPDSKPPNHTIHLFRPHLKSSLLPALENKIHISTNP